MPDLEPSAPAYHALPGQLSSTAGVVGASRNSSASSDSISRFQVEGNRNVTLSLWFTFLAGTGRGVWSFAVLSGYLYELTDSNQSVGIAEGVQGMCQLVAAVACGVLLDRFGRRDRVLCLSAAIGFVAAAFLVASLAARSDTLQRNERFLLLSVGLGLFGSYQGFWNTSLETIFSDSVPTGRREGKLTKKFMLTLLASLSGPLLANAYFYCFHADKWTVAALRDVFIGGVGVCVPPMALLCFFDDALMLGKSAEPVNTAAVEGMEGGGGAETSHCRESAQVGRNFVLRVTVLNDLISGLGSGMSVKFMPLYFKNSLRLNPTEVNWILIGATLVMAAGSFAARRQAKTYGRARVIMCFGLSGAAAMITLGALPSDRHGVWAMNWRLCVPLYFISCAQHCCRPLKKSILMDFSRRQERGGWNAVDSITRFGWSGSAVVGGFIIDAYGYSLAFLVTGAMLATAALLWPLAFRHIDAADAMKRPRAISDRQNERAGIQRGVVQPDYHKALLAPVSTDAQLRFED